MAADYDYDLLDSFFQWKQQLVAKCHHKVIYCYLETKIVLVIPGEVVIFMEKEEKALMQCLEVKSPSAIYDRLKKLFITNGWVEESQLVDALEAPLMRLCAYYLVVEKRRGYALDSVGKCSSYTWWNTSFYNLDGENSSSSLKV